MRPESIYKGASLAGNSDLTLLAPIKPGFVPSLDAVTYKTRVKRLLRALHTGRSSSQEFALLRPFSDAVERVGKIHSVRVAVLEADDKVLLSVSFEGTWESYVRVLWQKVGRLLDVIFCNTEGYVTSWDHSFEQWRQWAHSVQIETQFFYAMPALTVDDVHWLREEERVRRGAADSPDTDLAVTRAVVTSAEARAWQNLDRFGLDDFYEQTVKQGLQSLAGLYRLTDLYLPGSADGRILHGAACELLSEFIARRSAINPTLKDLRLQRRFGRQMDWLFQPDDASTPAGFRRPPLPTTTPQPEPLDDVQAGILASFARLNHGCLVLVAFASARAMAAFLDSSHLHITRNGQEAAVELACSVGFTLEGLRVAGMSDAEITAFPEEFRQGMEVRAAVLGDLRTNHPRRWRLPRANWSDDGPMLAGTASVPWGSVHAVVQLRAAVAGDAQGQPPDLGDPHHPLRGEIDRLFGRRPGVRVLAVEPMWRSLVGGVATEHFGYVDGNGQPTLDPADPDADSLNQIHLGELLLGYDNQADTAAGQAASGNAWLRNGTFLVVRKLHQDVAALMDAVTASVRDETASFTGLGLNQVQAVELILAKMMGRWRDGRPLVSNTVTNNFNYQADAEGRKCPFQAHIRRANPRRRDDEELPETPGHRTPRIMRRGMSYGPRWTPPMPGLVGSDDTERGLIFMAYNASIGEQFEVIQRWIGGGNSTGGYSGQNDPFLGVAENGQVRHFRFEHKGTDGKDRVLRVALDVPDENGQQRPLVRLEWGAYLFTPALHAIEMLHQRASSETRNLPWSVTKGAQEIARLRTIEETTCATAAILAWKAALEDAEAQQRFVSASIWAAIRELHGGVLCTPYGVLVADHDLQGGVLQDRDGRYSVCGYRERMHESIGENYLGLDCEAGSGAYDEQSGAANAAIMALSPDTAFGLAHRTATSVIEQLLTDAHDLARDNGDKTWELTLELREVIDEVLAVLCERWFGLSTTGGHFQRGPLRWDWKPGHAPFYPGHFTAPSRYIFQPHPGPAVVWLGQTYGQAVRDAAAAFVADLRARNARPTDPDGDSASVGDAIFGPVDAPTNVDLAARALVGGLMGFLPTIDGSLRRIFNEWLRDGSFWSLRSANAQAALDSLTAAHDSLAAALHEAMQLRPMPEMIWRTATVTHRLGKGAAQGVTVEAGETVVLALVSATQQALAQGTADVLPIFGGNRRLAEHPTHACPGYDAAMAVLLGVSAALVARRESMRPAIAPLTVTFEGKVLGSAAGLAGPERFDQRRSDRLAASVMALRRVGLNLNLTESAAGTGNLLLFGDSWFHYRRSGIFTKVNLATALEAIGYGVANNKGGMTLKLAELAGDTYLPAFLDLFEALLKTPGERPRAIFLSGGGNDAAREALWELINVKAEGVPLLNCTKVKAFVEGTLRDNYLKILARIRSLDDMSNPVPVILHGYDHPTSDGRYLGKPNDNPKAQLWPYIRRQGYDMTAGSYAEGTEIMKLLIDDLNEMMSHLHEVPGVGPVVHVKLCERLASKFPNYTDGWANELHPTEDGFAWLALKLHEAIDKLPK